MNLVRSDFSRRHLGSLLGAFWAFAGPLATVGVLLFVFNVGFRSGPVNGVPFDLWLISGLVVWFYISDAITSGCNSVIDYGFLVKKIPFRTELLPAVKICSSLYVHVINLVLLLVLFLYAGKWPTLYWLQLPYYLMCLVAFALSVAMTGAVIQVFFKDLQGVIAIAMQIGLWATPILWDAQILPERFRLLVHLNPVSYLVQGYRDSLLFNTWFFDRPGQTAWFWGLTLGLLAIGHGIFRRTKHEFADVL